MGWSEGALFCRGFDLGEDGGGGGGGVGGLGDGAADDEHVGSGGDGGGWGGDAFLVVEVGACGADAGCDEQAFVAQLAAEEEDFGGGADDAGHAAGAGDLREAEHLDGGAGVDADGAELLLVEAGEYGDGEELGGAGVGGGGLGGGGEHGGAAAGVEREQGDAGGGEGADGGGDGVGDVVQLEVEEDGEVAAGELGEDGFAVGEIELQADFEPCAGAFELVDHAQGGFGVGQVEGDDQTVAGGGFGWCHRDDCSGAGKRAGRRG